MFGKNKKQKVIDPIAEKNKVVKKYSKMGVTMPNLIISIKSLSAMLKAGMSLNEALTVISGHSEDKVLNKMYALISEDVSQGEKLADAMQKFPKAFPGIVISVVSSGEQAGSLEKNLLFLADFLKKEFELNRKIKSALIYPLIIIGLTVMELLGMMFVIIPKLEQLFLSFPNIPAFTRFLMNSSRFIRTNWYFLLAGFMVIYFLISLFLKSKPGKKLVAWLSLNFPILKKLFKFNILATLARTISILLSSGIHIAKALKISTTTIENIYYQNVLVGIYNGVKDGHSIADCMKKYETFFTPSYTKLIDVGEQTGTLEDNLMYLYEYYSEEVTEMSNNIVTFIEPILLILVGVIIGVLGLSIIMPLYQLMNSINA